MKKGEKERKKKKQYSNKPGKKQQNYRNQQVPVNNKPKHK
jgi:hypothetical protein